jgi:O-acetyl-ADP-ribose deacetylase (regulator of RNase III)
MVKVGKSLLELMQGDITDADCDAIVNAANTDLIMGGGVAGEIRRKGGSGIQKECDKIGRIRVGEAVITSGGNLRARHVIHAVGPRWGEGNEDAKLASATLNSLKVADRHGLRSVAFPAISSGIFGFPVDRCARIMLSETISYLQKKTGMERVVFYLYDSSTFKAFHAKLNMLTQQESEKDIEL